MKPYENEAHQAAVNHNQDAGETRKFELIQEALQRNIDGGRPYCVVGGDCGACKRCATCWCPPNCCSPPKLLG